MTDDNTPTGAARDVSDRELVFTRTFDAPRELVFRAWTDPAHLAHWWGPSGFTTTTYEMNLQPGGAWRFVMHGPDGVDYANRIVYREVVKSERLVYSHLAGDDDASTHFEVTVTFADQGDKTELTMQMLFASREARDRAIREFRAIEGANQTLDRLGHYLAAMERRSPAINR